MSDNRIVEACEKFWDEYTNDCSGFVKAVAAELGITLTGMANVIVDEIQKIPWKRITDAWAGREAARLAGEGNLVIGGLKAVGHGHVVIVVSGPVASDKYPTAYWGSLGGSPAKAKTVNWSWSSRDRDKIIYGYLPVP